MKLLASLPFSHLRTPAPAKAGHERQPDETTDRSRIELLTPEHLSEAGIQNEEECVKPQKPRLPSSDLLLYVNLSFWDPSL